MTDQNRLPSVKIHFPQYQLYRCQPRWDLTFDIGAHIYFWQNGPVHKRTFGVEMVEIFADKPKRARGSKIVFIGTFTAKRDKVIRNVSALIKATVKNGDSVNLYSETHEANLVAIHACEYHMGATWREQVQIVKDYFWSDLGCANFPHYNPKYQEAYVKRSGGKTHLSYVS